jgi:methylmalonyl-CoA mutase
MSNANADLPAEAQWRRLVEKALGGASTASLNAQLDTGAEIAPLYTPRHAGDKALASGHPGAAPFVRGASARPGARPWTVLQCADLRDPSAANAQAHEDLRGGADGLWLQISAGDASRGLGARDLGALDAALAEIPLAETPLYLSTNANVLPAAALLVALARKRGVSLDAMSGSLGLDPLADIAATGEAPVQPKRALDDAVDVALFARDERLGLTPLRASGRVWHDAGGSAVEELACTLAAAVAYWRALAEADVPLDEAAQMIGFHLVADPDVFVSMAKFRAMRALWARVSEAAGIAAQPAAISAEMSFRTMTGSDPHTNLLRATAAAFAAAVGGARAILVAPFTAASGVPDAFARRLARNTQVILAEESALGRVVDAPGGSAYVETLTHDLAAQAWAQFQEIETAGGLLAALGSGDVARRLTTVRARRDNEIARRERPITGVSTYTYLDEAAPRVLSETLPVDEASSDTIPDLPPAGQGERMAALVAAAEQGATRAELAAALRVPREPIPPLPSSRRDSRDFEDLRAASDAALAAVGARPSVFLANIGPLAAYTERATWAKNFFEAGGIAAIPGDGADSAHALAAEFRDSGASITCLCGRDADYAALAGVAEALREAGAAAVYIMATPATLDGLADVDVRAVDRVLHDGCNALSILREAHHRLQVGEVIAAARRRQAEEARTGWVQDGG